MQRNTLIGFFLLILGSLNVHAQDCDSLYNIAENYLQQAESKKSFITDGQVYATFLDNQKAEFTTTFYENTLYRIAASAGKQDNYAIFTVLDMDDNVLFSNKTHNNSPYWDFKVEHTLPVKIQTELDTNKKITGCLVLMIGFQQ